MQLYLMVILFVIFANISFSSCSKTSDDTLSLSSAERKEAKGYDNMILFVEDGTILHNRHNDVITIGPDVLRIEWKADGEFPNHLAIWSISTGGLQVVSLPNFREFIKKNTIRQASADELKDADDCRKKRDESIHLDEVNIRGDLVRVGDTADRTFSVFRRSYSYQIGEASVNRDTNTGKIIDVWHRYEIDNVQYRLMFEKKSEYSPYTLQILVAEPKDKITYRDYITKYKKKEK